MIGGSVWQGAHQGAQKPTSTGRSDLSTSCENVASVTAAIFNFSFLRAMGNHLSTGFRLRDQNRFGGCNGCWYSVYMTRIHYYSSEDLSMGLLAHQCLDFRDFTLRSRAISRIAS